MIETRSWRGSMSAALLLLVATAGTARAHDDDDEHPPPLTGAVTPAETAAYERARPVFERQCVKCHTAAGSAADPTAIEHLDLATYPFGGHHAGEAGAAVREALGATGQPPTMPDDHPGAVQGDDLKLVLAWADAFDAAHAHADGAMDMHMDMGGMAGMAMSPAPLGLSMARTGSGTAWQPDATPMAMHESMRGDWMLMLHYSLHAGFDAQSGDRGDSRAVGLGWVMAMASHPLGGGEVVLRAMLSPEPLTLGKRGYPLLLQTGEEVGGVALHDRQHPHDLFMELAARYAHAISDDVAVEAYVAPAGEPALGPVAFAHRPYALSDMTAPLGHHWEDSTHISFGVATLGVYTRTIKLEGSWFNGREPDEDRYDINLRVPDSYAGRVTVNPTASWSLEASYGYLAAPEQLEPGVSLERAVASATFAGLVGGRALEATVAIGHNAPSSGPATTAGLAEADLAAAPHVIAIGRVEALTKTGADLVLAPADTARTFGMAALSLGAIYELPAQHDVVIGVGVRGTIDVLGGALESYYGTRTPLGGLVYVEAHPARSDRGMAR